MAGLAGSFSGRRQVRGKEQRLLCLPLPTLRRPHLLRSLARGRFGRLSSALQDSIFPAPVPRRGCRGKQKSRIYTRLVDGICNKHIPSPSRSLSLLLSLLLSVTSPSFNLSLARNKVRQTHQAHAFFLSPQDSTCTLKQPTGRIMGFSSVLTQVALLVAILHQLHQVTAFPLHAAALNDIPLYSDSTDREWRLQVDAHVKEHLASILRDEAVNRLDKLGKVSDSQEFLQRTFMSPASLRAGQLIRTWMADAGLFTWIDDMGNVHGRFDGMNSSAPALLIGSHLDTVIDAGRYDGALGIISAIAAVKALQKSGRLVEYPRPIEIIAFSDEEGVRFQSTFLGSGAIAGILSPNLLQVKDKRGVTVQQVLQKLSFPGTTDSITNLKYEPESVWGYVEVHIEQGPVLEAKGLPLGVVDAIAGQTRLRVSMKGSAGHAGTVPMAMRKDPMPAAAQAIVAIEELCIRPPLGDGQATVSRPTANKGGALVCTVGEIASWPGASNVIPGEVTFSVDVRAKDDGVRDLAVLNMEHTIHEICRNRAIACTIERKNEAKTVDCDKELTERLRESGTDATSELFSLTGIQTTSEGPVPTLSSGAGHDALAMAQLTKVGIMFVRCTGGISHSPEEHVLDDDIWAAGLSLHSFLEADLPKSVSA